MSIFLALERQKRETGNSGAFMAVNTLYEIPACRCLCTHDLLVVANVASFLMGKASAFGRSGE